MSKIPEQFYEQVKDALESIYDYPALQTHPFTEQINQINPESRDDPVHQVRRMLIDAIETLNPGNHEGVRIGTKRIYNLLHLHYVGGMTLQEVALELGISVRQAYRDLKKGQDSVASVVWFKFKPDEQVETAETMNSLSSVESEMTQLEGDVQWVNMTELITSLVSALARLAEQLNVDVALELLPDVMVSTNPTIARQTLMNLLSRAIQQTESEITLRIEDIPHQIILHLIYPTQDTEIPPIVSQFAKQLGWRLQQNLTGVQIIMSRVDTTILLIDDNKGLADLMKRYLNSESYQVIAAYNGVDGLRLAQDTIPDVIIMDIMMPDMDGWELLQRLRIIPSTCAIPTVVCSVIDDPQLAFSLGASKCITKPINKEKLYHVLAELDL